MPLSTILIDESGSGALEILNCLDGVPSSTRRTTGLYPTGHACFVASDDTALPHPMIWVASGHKIRVP
jgi:hypothetical protein